MRCKCRDCWVKSKARCVGYSTDHYLKCAKGLPFDRVVDQCPNCGQDLETVMLYDRLNRMRKERDRLDARIEQVMSEIRPADEGKDNENNTQAQAEPNQH